MEKEFCNGRNKKIASFSVGAFSNKMVDAVGTGDALLSYASLSLKVSPLVVAAILGSFAAACECEVEGNIVINKDKIEIKSSKKINYLHYQMKIIIVGLSTRQEKEKIVKKKLFASVDKKIKMLTLKN